MRKAVEFKNEKMNTKIRKLCMFRGARGGAVCWFGHVTENGRKQNSQNSMVYEFGN
jgi:hypothetical protein